MMPTGTIATSLIIAVFALNETSSATPIALAFDAIIGPPRQGADGFVPPSLGVSLQPSDIVSGRFTFEPVDAPSSSRETNAVEAFPFAINIKSATLVSTQFRIASSNNIHVDVDCINDSCLEDYDGIDVYDAFGTISAVDQTQWASTINLMGPISNLDGPDIPPDPRIWNQFVPSQTFVLTFYDPASTSYYGLIATIESFRAIPEPPTYVLISIPPIFVFLWNATRRI